MQYDGCSFMSSLCSIKFQIYMTSARTVGKGANMQLQQVPMTRFTICKFFLRVIEDFIFFFFDEFLQLWQKLFGHILERGLWAGKTNPCHEQFRGERWNKTVENARKGGKGLSQTNKLKKNAITIEFIEHYQRCRTSKYGCYQQVMIYFFYERGWVLSKMFNTLQYSQKRNVLNSILHLNCDYSSFLS